MTDLFDAYAKYYDLLYHDKDYAAETEFVTARLHKYIPVGSRILELGCGTGAHAECLARHGFHVDGVDMSSQMLARAHMRKAALPLELGERLSFLAGDVRTVRTRKKYDAVISLFHVVSYQNRNDELKSMFVTAASHLDVGGIFMFDYWYGPAVLLQKPEPRVKILSDDQIDVVRNAQPVLRLAENVVDVNYSVVIKQKSTGEIRYINETHSMRYLFLPELPLLAGEVYWEDFENFAWMKSTKPTEADWAGFSIMRRR